MVVSVARGSTQRGVTLVELLIAIVISAIVLAALNGLVKLGVDAQTTGRANNELTYQARFALDRMADKARALTPRLLTVPAAGTTADWFAPAGCSGAACVKYCLNGSNQLIETVVSDATCSGTTVIASRVTAFVASVPANSGALDRSVAVLSLDLADGTSSVSLTSSVRLGGGSL
jgi:prepilin-type N-terminal cleavage/methylation domain-containing protein